MVFKNKRKRKNFKKRPKPEFEQKLLDLARVTRVVKGGRRFSFRATVVIGNRKGKVGVGVGKGTDVSNAIQKGFADAKKHLISVDFSKGTISHEIFKKDGSAKIMLKPAAEGRGIIAGGAVRVVVDLLGIKDIVSKSFGTANKLNVARGTIEALKELAPPRIKEEDEKVAKVKVSAKKVVDKKVVAKKPANKAEKKVEFKKVNKKRTASPKEVKKVVSKKKKSDDLTKIEGIGPKIAEVFANNKIETFKELADAKKEVLVEILSENKLSGHDPSTWGKQAVLAKDEKWDELKVLQDELNGGK